MQVFCPLARDSKPVGRQLAHFRRQPPGPPGPLAEQPRMTSVPVLARGFTAQECRRGLGEAAAQGADVRPHFFPPSLNSLTAAGPMVSSRARQPTHPVPSPLVQGEKRLHVCTLRRVYACMSESWQPGKVGTVGKLPGGWQASVSGPLEGYQSVSLWWSVSLSGSLFSQCLNFHLFVSKSLSLSLSRSHLSSLLSLPPWKPTPSQVKQPPRFPKEGTGLGCISVQAGLSWQPWGTASAPSWAGRLSAQGAMGMIHGLHWVT